MGNEKDEKLAIEVKKKKKVNFVWFERAEGKAASRRRGREEGEG